MIVHRSRAPVIDRPGNASLELVIFLPILSVFLLAIFAVTAVTLSHGRVEMTSRYESWKFRHTPWKAERTASTGLDVAQRDLAIVGGETRVHPARVVVHESEAPILQFLEGIAPQSARRKHVVWGGVWDHREIRFADHPRLTLVDKANYFSFGNFPLQACRALGEF